MSRRIDIYFYTNLHSNDLMFLIYINLLIAIPFSSTVQAYEWSDTSFQYMWKIKFEKIEDKDRLIEPYVIDILDSTFAHIKTLRFTKGNERMSHQALDSDGDGNLDIAIVRLVNESTIVPVNESNFKVSRDLPLLVIDGKVIVYSDGIKIPTGDEKIKTILNRHGEYPPIGKDLFIAKTKDQEKLLSEIFKLTKYTSWFTFPHKLVAEDILDVYYSFSFDISEQIQGFCPLSFELGNWPEKIINYKFRNREIGLIYINFQKIKSNAKVLVLYGKNISLLITRPDNYYFSIACPQTCPPIVSICTDLSSDCSELFKGVKMYCVNQKFDKARIAKLIYYLENPSEFEIGPKISLEEWMIEGQKAQTKAIYQGRLLGLTRQLIGYEVEIIVKVNEKDFKSIQDKNQTLEILTFTYLHQGLNRNVSVFFDEKNREYKFEETVRFEGNPLFYPFDNYKATIQLYPARFIEMSDQKSSDGFITYSHFSKEKVKIKMCRNVWRQYFLGLILSFIGLVPLWINRQMKIFNILYGCVVVGPFFAFTSFNLLWSIGGIPFGIISLFLIIIYLVKKVR